MKNVLDFLSGIFKTASMAFTALVLSVVFLLAVLLVVVF